MVLTGARRRRTLLLVGLLLVTTGCSTVADFLGEDAVLDTGIEPSPLAFEGPTYMAVEGRTLLVRNGDDEQQVPGGRAVHWLPDGNALIDVDARRGRTLPRTDNPDATAYNELERNYFGAVPTIDGVTFAKWHDGSEWYEDGDHGVLRIDGDEQENVLVNANIVGLYLSADGTGLLGLRQSSGDPCGGCVVGQDIVEIDPATGRSGRSTACRTSTTGPGASRRWTRSGGEETPLPGELASRPLGEPAGGSVAGQLLPPA